MRKLDYQRKPTVRTDASWLPWPVVWAILVASVLLVFAVVFLDFLRTT